MITCPDCGQAAPDEARFCEQCGRGLQDLPPAPIALPPLPTDAQLQSRFKIVDVIGQSSVENRYRAVALDDPNQWFVLRERVAPVAPATEDAEPKLEPVAAAVQSTEEDPAGPRASTRDLTPLAKGAVADQSPAAETSDTSAETAGTKAAGDGLVELETESEQTPAEDAKPGAEARVDPAANGAQSAKPEASETSDAQQSEAVDSGGPWPNGAEQTPAPPRADLGEVFERVLALSQSVTHPAYYRALEGFAQDGRVYLVYKDEQLKPFAPRKAGAMFEHQALSAAIQICQAVSYLHNRGMRVNDICPASLGYGADGRVKLTSLDYISNDNELQAEPILNDGYSAPEIYRARKVDKRADVFSIGCVLYTCLTGERIECETWREEAGPIRFYPPHVVTPDLEKAVRRALAFKPQDRWPGTDQLKAELLKLSSQLRVRSACLTDVGMVREHNEDSIMALEFAQDSQVSPGSHYLYVVSDGMGGAEAGETASAIAVETIRYYVGAGVAQERVSVSAQMQPAADQPADPQVLAPASSPVPAASPPAPASPGPASPPRPASMEELLRTALEQANRDIVGYQAGHPESRGMGATAVSALLTPPEAVIAWVGDSRAYLLENGRLRQLTKDHSLVQRLVDIGQITAEEARSHEHKNVITRSLGARSNGPAGAESLTVRLKRGDRLMLCSDGLMAHVEDSAIAEILARQQDPMAASRELVVAANAGGGTDNISVIVIDAE
jgi:serine/threonine protein phosphatase PrpC